MSLKTRIKNLEREKESKEEFVPAKFIVPKKLSPEEWMKKAGEFFKNREVNEQRTLSNINSSK